MPTSVSEHHAVSGGIMTSEHHSGGTMATQHHAVSVRTIINVCLLFVVICVSSAAKPSQYAVVKRGATNVQMFKSGGNYRLRTPPDNHETGSRSPLTTPRFPLTTPRSPLTTPPLQRWSRSRSRLLPRDKWSRSRLLPRVKGKRDTGQKTYTVETVVIIDFDLFEDFKNIYGDKAMKKSKEYAAFVLKGVDDIYSSTDFNGFTLEIKLCKVFVITETENKITTKTVYTGALEKVREYVKKHILGGEYKKFDHVTLLVASEARLDVNPEWRSTGLTFGGKEVMCNASSSYIVIRVNDTLTRTIAHFIGLNLGVGHDHFTHGFAHDGDCDAGYLMSVKTKVPKSNRFKFSYCSNKYISESVEEDWSACLKESNLDHSDDLPDVSARLFGTVFNTTQQCQIVFGRNSKVNTDLTKHGCRKDLFCVLPDGTNSAVGIYPYDGTPCSESHVCNKGECNMKVKQEKQEKKEKEEKEKKGDKNTGVCNVVVVDTLVAIVVIVVVVVYI